MLLLCKQSIRVGSGAHWTAIAGEKVEGIANLLMLNSEQDGRNALGGRE